MGEGGDAGSRSESPEAEDDENGTLERERSKRALRVRIGATALIVIAVVIGVVLLTRPSLPDDPQAGDALPGNVTYGAYQWTPQGSLAQDADFIRDALEHLDTGGESVHFLWAGRGTFGVNDETDVAIFARYANDASTTVVGVDILRRDADGDWAQRSGKGDYGSFDNAIIPISLDEIEGIDGASSMRYFLVRGDVGRAPVRTMDGSVIEVVGGVIGAEFEDFGEAPPFVFDVETAQGRAFTSAHLVAPLTEADWTERQAARTLEDLRYLDVANDGALAELDAPQAVRFGGGVGFVVAALQHNVRAVGGSDPPNPYRQRSSLLIAAPGRDLAHTGPAQDGHGEERHPVHLDAEYAVAVESERVFDGPAVAVSRGRVSTTPELPVIGEPVEAGGPTIYGEAPERTALVWSSDDGSPRQTALVTFEADE